MLNNLYICIVFVKQNIMEYTAIIQKGEDDIYTAQCEQIPEALTQGSTIDETLENLKDAILLCLDYKKEQTQKKHAGHKYIRRKVKIA